MTKKSTEPHGIIVLAVVIVINIITIIIINNIITTMCTEVFLFFRREEICHVVNVVCISLHVCERKMKSEMAFFFKILVPFIFMI